MSHLEGGELEEPEFKWLKEAEGKRDRDIQFYESFAYDGVEYSLYDSVYLHEESEKAPYIGKLVSIWEDANKSKKIRVQWFFRPSEISYYLGDTEVLQNELFFASGCGTGLLNINPLESITGKCNVVCTSIDDRNPQPSDIDKYMADFVFYRTFDVQTCMISDQLNDTIGELKVEFVFNRKESLRTLNSPRSKSNKHDTRNDVGCEDTSKLARESSPNLSPYPNGNGNHMVENDGTDTKQVYVAKEELFGDVENRSFDRESTFGQRFSNVDVNSSVEKVAKSTIDDRIASGDKIVGRKINVEKVKVKQGRSLLKQAQFQEKVKLNKKSHGLDDTPLTRGKVDDLSSKDYGKNIDVNSSKDRQAISNIKNISALGDNKDGCRYKDKAKDKKSPRENHFEEIPQSNIGFHCLNDTSLNRGKLDVNSTDDRDATGTIDNKSISNVKNVERKVNHEKDMVKNKKFPLKQSCCDERIKYDINPDCSNDTSLVRKELIDKSSKINGKASLLGLIICENNGLSPVNGAISCDAKLELEIDKDYEGLRRDAKLRKSSTILNERISKVGTASGPKILEPGHITNFVSTLKDLDSAKCWNASGGKSSKTNDVIGDKIPENKSNDDFEGFELDARHAKLSSNIVNQLSNACVYHSNEKIDNVHDSVEREDLSLMKDSCFGDVPFKKEKLDQNKSDEENSVELVPKSKEKSCGFRQDVKHAKNSITLVGVRKRSASPSKGMPYHGHGASEGNDLTFAKDPSAIERASKRAKCDGSRETSSKSIKSDVSQKSKEKSCAEEDRKVDSEIFEVSQRPMIEKGCRIEQDVKHAKNSNTLVELRKRSASQYNGMPYHGHGACEGNDLTFAKDSSAVKGPSKKAKLDGSRVTSKSIKSDVSQNSKEKSCAKGDTQVGGEIFEVSPRPMIEKSCGIRQDVKHAKDSSTLVGVRKRYDSPYKGMPYHGHGACEGNDSTFAKNPFAVEGPSKKAKRDGSRETSKSIKSDVSQISKEKSCAKEDRKVDGEIFEVSSRPMIEKCTWLKLDKLSWENIKVAHNEGKLVLLQNLDPTFTSVEVQDIMWHAFEVECTAKMMQHTAISSPHNGQALLIFNTRELAEKVLKKLDEKCLMLLNQRPLVGCTVLLPEVPSTQTAFIGHMYIDKLRRQLQMEMKEAVSTSHFSQSNTIEYEMALEWCFLQAKSKIWWQRLFERQEMKLKKRMTNFRLK